VIDELEAARASYAEHAWIDAHRLLSREDEATRLGADDLERLAMSAYMLGRDEEWASGLERAHHAYLTAGEPARAVRCAFWLGLSLALRGEAGRANGWLGRARRLLDREPGDHVEEGYLLIPVAAQHERAGDYQAAYATATAAAAIGERFGDADLTAIAVHEQGAMLVKQGQVAAGLALLDEAMLAVTTGELSPIPTGLVYCSVIAGCQDVFELRRAQEWTAALTHWCEQQPDMVAFTGKCLVHRSEIMQLHGAWPDALEEARRARERCAQGMNEFAAGEALYRQGELHRLRGQIAAAEAAYRDASRAGWEPQPGLALLRSAAGNDDAAATAIRRVLDETEDRLRRARMLPACVEIMLAVGEVEPAREACRELAEISAQYESVALDGMGAHARAAVALADGDAKGALVAARHAHAVWQELDAPYEAARARVHVGLACRALGDDEAAALELEAARGTFERLRAAPDLARVDALTRAAAPIDAHGLSPRELQVLRLVAGGKTNKAIAEVLVLSERTVDRHVSNIFTKLGVSSRAAATAAAYEHALV
jgi:DNA-binding NarL/FixJ family response regulator